LNLVLNPEYGDITDCEDGTDLTLGYGKPPGAQFPKTTLTPRRRTSPLCDDAVGGEEECARLLKTVPDMENLFTRKPQEEVESIFNEFMNTLGDDAEASEPTVSLTTTTTSVDAAFQDLLGN
jgi:hypothetical protein